MHNAHTNPIRYVLEHVQRACQMLIELIYQELTRTADDSNTWLVFHQREFIRRKWIWFTAGMTHEVVHFAVKCLVPNNKNFTWKAIEYISWHEACLMLRCLWLNNSIHEIYVLYERERGLRASSSNTKQPNTHKFMFTLFRTHLQQQYLLINISRYELHDCRVVIGARCLHVYAPLEHNTSTQASRSLRI